LEVNDLLIESVA
jgi:17beta-estradiol 17-dehydrogenase / very-long-chain 3-oxoacyl-CoA reductase